MDNNFSIYWNPSTGEFKFFEEGPFYIIQVPLKPLSIELSDDGFIEFQFYREFGGDSNGPS